MKWIVIYSLVVFSWLGVSYAASAGQTSTDPLKSIVMAEKLVASDLLIKDPYIWQDVMAITQAPKAGLAQTSFQVFLQSLQQGDLHLVIALVLVGLLLLLRVYYLQLNDIVQFQVLSPLLLQRICWFVLLLTVGYFAHVFFRGQLMLPNVERLVHSVFYIITVIVLMRMLLAVKITSRILIIGINTGLLISIGLYLLGFANFCIYFLTGFIATLLLFLTVYILYIMSKSLVSLLSSEKFQWQKAIHKQLAIKANTAITEFYCLNIAFRLIMWLSFMLLLVRIWDIDGVGYQLLYGWFINGFFIAKVHVVPVHIILGFLVFVPLALLTRFLRQRFSMRQELYMPPGAQHAIASFVGYLGFTLSLLLALMVAGVNFTGLAVIAGALTVGIGFGLQSMVKDFFSGIILLMERPIKAGDRIQVGDTEGYVKAINIRTTRVTTLAKTDIIIPNSEFTSERLTNFMFNNQLWRAQIKTHVAYGSDTDLVKSLLLEIAHAHPEVVTDLEGLEPRVLFREFGESALKLELWSYIRDVNKKNGVLSDLHFSINKVFREKGIEIAFPQRDLHMK